MQNYRGKRQLLTALRWLFIMLSWASLLHSSSNLPSSWFLWDFHFCGLNCFLKNASLFLKKYSCLNVQVFWFILFCRMILLLIQGSNGPWLMNFSFQKCFSECFFTVSGRSPWVTHTLYCRLTHPIACNEAVFSWDLSPISEQPSRSKGKTPHDAGTRWKQRTAKIWDWYILDLKAQNKH